MVPISGPYSNTRGLEYLTRVCSSRASEIWEYNMSVVSMAHVRGVRSWTRIQCLDVHKARLASPPSNLPCIRIQWSKTVNPNRSPDSFSFFLTRSRTDGRRGKRKRRQEPRRPPASWEREAGALAAAGVSAPPPPLVYVSLHGWQHNHYI
jgi:hypothetical protein